MTAAMWKPVVVGVDESPQAARAAAAGIRIAQAAHTECVLVHATERAEDLEARAEPNDRLQRLAQMRAKLPPEALHHLLLRAGKVKNVLVDVVRERGAGLLVVGGKHHAAPARWLGGSTAHHAIKSVDIPILIIGHNDPGFERVLAAVDSSYASGPTVEMAMRVADLFDAELRVVHVSKSPEPEDERLKGTVERMLHNGGRGLELVSGSATRAIGDIVREWGADLLIVGSHSKRWIDRRLLGSTTVSLLNKLPTSLVVVPIRAPKASTTLLIDTTRSTNPDS